MWHNIGTLTFRVLVSVMMMTHGWGKLMGFPQKSAGFPDPIGWGSEVSLVFVVLAEFFCSILIMLGVFTRWACILPGLTMIGAWYLHAFQWGDGWARQELAVLYLVCYIAISTIGPGDWSIDHKFLKRKYNRWL